MTTDTEAVISELSANDIEHYLHDLGMLLYACVQGGASVSFIQPFTVDQAEAFWICKVLPAVRGGGLTLLVAQQHGRIVGSVQLDHDTPPNQAHRAEVRKLLVHPDFRRRGTGRTLMRALEQTARKRGSSLLTLDTRTGDKAEPLYASLGYRTVGVIPGYSRAPAGDDFDATTIMYKML